MITILLHIKLLYNENVHASTSSGDFAGLKIFISLLIHFFFPSLAMCDLFKNRNFITASAITPGTQKSLFKSLSFFLCNICLIDGLVPFFLFYQKYCLCLMHHHHKDPNPDVIRYKKCLHMRWEL